MMENFMNYDFNINKIVFVCLVPAGTGDSTHENRPSHGIAINKGGEKIYTFSNGKKLTLKENDIIYLPKSSSYIVESTVCGDCYAINFDIEEDTTFEPFVIKVKNHNEIIECFRTANKTWALKKPGHLIKCKAELYNIIYAIQQECFSEYFPAKKLNIIKPAIDYIHNNYTKELIGIEMLSEMCEITPEYFRRIFKSFYGSSPIRYINNLKIARAKELLESKMYSVTEVAMQAGYAEMSHFSREFKKSTGLSPLEYKRSAQ